MTIHKVPIFGVLLAFLIAIALWSGIAALLAPTDEEVLLDRIQALSRAEFAETFNADLHPLDGLVGVEGAFAVVTGTVTNMSGPEVTLTDEGFVTYGEDNGFPLVTISGLEVFEKLTTGNENNAELKSLRESARLGESIELIRTNGLLRSGERYALFLGRWDADTMSILYAHDLRTDLPADGFAVTSDEVLARMEELNRGQAKKSRLNMLVQLSRDAKRAAQGDEVSDLLAAATGTVIDHGGLVDDGKWFPLAEDDPYSGSFNDLVAVEILVLFDEDKEPGSIALEGSTRRLGWFSVNDGSFVLATGFVLPGDYRILKQPPTDEKARVLPLAMAGAQGNRFKIERGDADIMAMLIDLRTDSPGYGIETFSDPSNLDQYITEMMMRRTANE